MPRFQDIPQFTRSTPYGVDVGWDYLPHHYHDYIRDFGLNVCPDFQRGYVWTPEQKVRYVEFILRGGLTGRDIYLNCPGWSVGKLGDFVLVDGKQRLDAVLSFLNNDFPVFEGHYFRDFTDPLRMTGPAFRFHVNTLKTQDEVFQWYLDLNTGGTVHNPEELSRVQALIGTPKAAEPSLEERVILAGLDRPLFAKATEEYIRQEAAREAAKLEKLTPKKTKKGKAK